MDFKSLISKIESIDGKIETPAAPKLADPVFLNEDASLRVLAGVTALSEELKKVGDKTTTHKGGTVTKTATGVKHEKKDDYDGEDHSEPAQKKASKAGMTGAERREQKAADKAEEKKSKEWEKKHGKGSVTRHKMEDVEIDTEKFKEKFSKMVEAAKPDFLDIDKDGDKKEPMKKAAADKGGDKKDGKKGMSAKQEKYFGKKNESVEEGKGDYSAKKARAGKDIGKPGKQFEKIAKKAGEKYGSKERGEKVAGAVLKKLRAKEGVESTKAMVAESVETKMSFKDMIKLVRESGGQQAIDPVDQTLWSWANRVAASKVQESQKAEIFAAMIYERNGGRFEMYDVLAEDQK